MYRLSWTHVTIHRTLLLTCDWGDGGEHVTKFWD